MLNEGFHVESPCSLPPSLHSHFEQSFHGLHLNNFFQYDAVQPGRKKLSETFVTRTLVGNPGTTYKYLGLRLFSHPWCEVDELGNRRSEENCGTSSLLKLGYTQSASKALITMGAVNRQLTTRSNTILSQTIAPDLKNLPVGSAEYNLTLINRMEPMDTIQKSLKPESLYGMGKTSVSWHTDSGLQDFSSIAVYHTLEEEYSSSNSIENHSSKEKITTPSSAVEDISWKVALRVSSNTTKASISSSSLAINRTPALCIPLPSGSLYYLLDEFNHTHEHAVISGSHKLRYSSTHRVAREGRGTWQYIRDKCQEVIETSTIAEFISLSSIVSDDINTSTTTPKTSNQQSTKTNSITSSQKKKFLKDLRKEQQLLQELEFEWLRQWQVQGLLHADLHPYWHQPMQNLYNSFAALELRLNQVVTCLQNNTWNSDITAAGATKVVAVDMYDVIIESLEERIKSRKIWQSRLSDSVFKSMIPARRPMAFGIISSGSVVCGGNSNGNKSISAHSSSPTMHQHLEVLRDNVRNSRASFIISSQEDSTSNEELHSDVTFQNHKNQQPQQFSSARSSSDKKAKQSKRESKKNNKHSTEVISKQNQARLTKKEQKKVPSNWERMKISMK